jgi:hypothetical protein
MAQKTAKVTTNQTFVNYQLDNSIKFSINYPCESVIVKTDNGTVKNYGDCHCQVIPSELRDVKLSFFKSKNSDTLLIGETRLTVRVFSDFTPYLTTQDAIKDSSISKSALLFTDGLLAYPNGGYCSEQMKVRITKVHIVGVRNDLPLFDLTCSSGIFSSEIMESFKKMQVKDELFILGQANDLTGAVVQLKSIHLTIK